MTSAEHIQITDVQAGTVKVTSLGEAAPKRLNYDPIEDLQQKVRETAVSRRTSNMREAFVLTPDAGSLLRDGLRYIAFTSFNEIPQSFASFTTRFNSTRPHEEYLRDSGIGVLPTVRSGAETPRVMSSLDGGVKIENRRYATIVEVTGDDLRFDRLGMIARQLGPELGRAGRATEEQEVYNAITTTANFTRSNTTGDNDVGANTQTATFNAANIELAYSIIATAKDRRSSMYLGMTPNTLVCGPRLKFAAMQLLMADSMMRVGGNTTNEVRGTGTTPIYRGLITNIIVSPWIGTSFQWALVDSTRPNSLVFQEVEPFNVIQSSMGQDDEQWFARDIIRFRADGYFGVGIADDRPWFFSDSTTAPTVS
ncbi:MAG: hypothetical protein EBR82_40480 [Caulobacteraceae bacterium]|nr:hypothetical protein [Caulobacteraceae bacterium]